MSADILEWQTDVCFELAEESAVAIDFPAAVAINTGPLAWETLIAQTLAEEVPL